MVSQLPLAAEHAWVPDGLEHIDYALLAADSARVEGVHRKGQPHNIDEFKPITDQPPCCIM